MDSEELKDHSQEGAPPGKEEVNVHYGRGQHPNARAKQWKPGQSGGGRYPKGQPNMTMRFRTFLEKWSKVQAPEKIANTLKQSFPNIDKKTTVNELEALRVHISALQGEPWAYDRLHGKAVQPVEMDAQGNVNVNTNMNAEGLQNRIKVLEEQLKFITSQEPAREENPPGSQG
jgi:hypothetical protein